MNWNGNLEQFAHFTETTNDVDEFVAALRTIPQNAWDDMVEERLIGALGRASLSDDRLDSAKDLERRLLDIPMKANDPDIINKKKWDVFKSEMSVRGSGVAK